MKLLTPSKIQIDIRHPRTSGESCVVIAPGFFQSKETSVFRRLEKDLLDFRDVISMDFRGHGRSGGLYTFSARETEDLKTVLDYAHARYRSVGVLGFSYGGSIALLTAAQHGGMASIACVGSPMAPEEVEFHWWKPGSMRLGLQNLGRGAGCRPGNPFLPKTRAIDIISKVKTPVFFMHGAKDPTVAVRHSRLMHDQKTQGTRRLHVIAGGSHAEDLYRTHRREFLKEITGWFGETLV